MCAEYIDVALINGQVIKGKRADFVFNFKDSGILSDCIMYKSGILRRYINLKHVLYVDVNSDY